MLGAHHFVPIRLQGGDQLLEARAIGPKPVGEYDTWFFCAGMVQSLRSRMENVCQDESYNRFPV